MEKPGKSVKMTGVLPEGWRDDSSWADVAGEYLPEEFEGTRYLRARIDLINSGSAQLAAPFRDANPSFLW